MYIMIYDTKSPEIIQLFEVYKSLKMLIEEIDIIQKCLLQEQKIEKCKGYCIFKGDKPTSANQIILFGYIYSHCITMKYFTPFFEHYRNTYLNGNYTGKKQKFIYFMCDQGDWTCRFTYFKNLMKQRILSLIYKEEQLKFLN